MSTLTAIIPARGGSKRLPRKNILELGGKPMIVWPIQAALESGLFREVIVSTEDPEVAATARMAGAEIMRRPEALTTDASTVAEVCLHVLDQLDAEGRPVDIFCCLYATAAFILPGDLALARNLLDKQPEPDVVMGVSQYNYHPYLAVTEDENGFLERAFPQFRGVKSNTFPKMVCSNGTLYFARTEAFRREGTFYQDKTRGLVLPPTRAVDMDTPEDLHFASMLARLR